MGFIKEEDEARLVRIANLGKLLEQFRQQPEQEGGVEFWTVDQAGGIQHVHDAAPIGIGAHHVRQFQCGFAEEEIGTFAFHDEQVALHRAKRRRGNVAVFLAEFVADLLVAHMNEQFAQILQVKQQQAIIVGIFERDVQHAFLRVGEVHQPREEQGPHFGNRGADRMALLAEHVPEHGWRRRVLILAEPDLVGACNEFVVQLVIRAAGYADARKVTFHVRAEDRNARIGKALSQVLQGDCLAGAGCARDQAMPVCDFQQQVLRHIWRAGALGICAPDKDGIHHPVPFIPYRLRR